MTNQLKTLAFYNSNANSFVEQTIGVDMHQLYHPFIATLPARSPNQQHILDLGCGSGRDSIYFATLGFNVTAIDGSQALIDLAQSKSAAKQDTIEWYCATFEDIAQENWQHKFTAIWSCASLLHVPYRELPELIEKLLHMLTEDGGLYASFKCGDSERIEDGRFFNDMNEVRWAATKQKIACDCKEETWLTLDQRADRNEVWFNIMIRKL